MKGKCVLLVVFGGILWDKFLLVIRFVIFNWEMVEILIGGI